MGQRHDVAQVAVEVEMGVIVAGVNARVGAAAACDGDGLSQLKAKAGLNGLLHADGMRLDLVAMIAAAVVGHMDEITRHYVRLRMQN